MTHLAAVLLLLSFPDDEARPLRSFAVRSPAVVLAVPLDPVAPLRFRVVESLRGPQRVGSILAPKGLSAEGVRGLEPAVVDGEVRPRRVEQALLFLDGDALVAGRFATADGRVFASRGKGALLEKAEGNWSILLRRVREDLGTVRDIERMARLRPERRVPALVGWLERHRGTLVADAGGDEAPAGWDELPERAFAAIFAAVAPEKAWPALRLHAEVIGGSPPTGELFRNERGRSALVDKAGDPSALSAERARALALLGRDETLRGLGAEERDRLIDRLAAKLPGADDAVTAEAARAVAALDRGDPTRRSPRAIPALTAAYRESRPGPGRDELALALADLGAPPASAFAVLRDFARDGKSFSALLTPRFAGKAVHRRPEVVCERLNLVGAVADTKRYAAVALNEPDWAEGWRAGPLALNWAMPDLQPGGYYRVRVEGRCGKDEKWASEPRQFRVPALSSDARARAKGPNLSDGW